MASSNFEQDTKPEPTPEQLDELVEDLKSPKHIIRAYAGCLLGKHDASAIYAVPRIVALLTDENSDIRISAAHTLSEMGPFAAAAVPLVMEHLKNKNSEIRLDAAYALGQMGSVATSSVFALIESLKDRNGCVRYGAAEALGRIAVDGKDGIREADVSELMRALSLWQNAMALLDSMDSKGTDYPEEFEEAQAAVRRLVAALEKEKKNR